MDKTIAISMDIANQSHSATHIKGLLELAEEKVFVNAAIVETKHLYSDAVRLTEASAEYFAFVIGDSNYVAGLQVFGGLMDGT